MQQHLAHLFPTREGLALAGVILAKRNPNGTFNIRGREKEIHAQLQAAYGKVVTLQAMRYVERGCELLAKVSDKELEQAAYPFHPNPHARTTSGNDFSDLTKGLMMFALTGLNDIENVPEGKARLLKMQGSIHHDSLLKSYGLPTWAQLTKDDDNDDDDGDDDNDDDGTSAGGGNSHYNPDEPRIPAGQPGGGQWTTAGNGTSTDSGSISVDDIRSDPSETITQVSSIEPMAYTTTQIISDNKDINAITSGIQTSDHGSFAPLGTVLDANGNPVNQVNIFVGGYGDENTHLVGNSDILKEAIGSNYYFNWQQGSAIDDFIRSLPPDTSINLIGHSYGGDTAAQVAVNNPGYVQTLITVDPVSHFDFNSYSTIDQLVGTWVNVNAVPNPTEPSTGGDTAAFWGGKWGAGPQNAADIYIAATQHHEGFTNMMNTVASNGKTPLQILNSIH